MVVRRPCEAPWRPPALCHCPCPSRGEPLSASVTAGAGERLATPQQQGGGYATVWKLLPETRQRLKEAVRRYLDDEVLADAKSHKSFEWDRQVLVLD